LYTHDAGYRIHDTKIQEDSDLVSLKNEKCKSQKSTDYKKRRFEVEKAPLHTALYFALSNLHSVGGSLHVLHLASCILKHGS
jgi:hypothetical protein